MTLFFLLTLVSINMLFCKFCKQQTHGPYSSNNNPISIFPYLHTTASNTQNIGDGQDNNKRKQSKGQIKLSVLAVFYTVEKVYNLSMCSLYEKGRHV